MNACIRIRKDAVIARVDDRIYSSFIEHMGRAVYTGIYEPDHPTADNAGFRGDVAALIFPLGLSHVRYPGGNFLSGYDWKDGIGPKGNRPMRPELAWQALEPNEVGTDEFLQWCERMDVSPMLGVNLGTGTPKDAAELLEYVNGDLPTHFADLRRKNGRNEPYGVKLWCLGNEMDGPWQICAKTAEEYACTACETAKMMKWLDPGIELVACGSSFREMPTFGQWERTVLEHCYPYIDYLSLHQYYQNNDGDIPSFLSRSMDMDAFIREVAAICREVKEKTGQQRDVRLSFDEWNVWYHFQKEGKTPAKWTVARPIEEEVYDTADALLVGCMLNTLLKNADTVRIACTAQLVNVIAPIMTEPGGRAWAQTIYYPFRYASKYGRGTSLFVEQEGPAYACAAREKVPYLDSAAVARDDGSLAVFLINRSEAEPMTVRIDADGCGAFWKAALTTLCASPDAVNTADSAPVRPTETVAAVKDGALTVTLPAFSWSCVLLIKENMQR